MHTRHVWWTTIGELFAIAMLLTAPFVVQADIGSFVEDFGSIYNREERTTFAVWDATKRQVSLPKSGDTYAASAAAESRTIANAYGQLFRKATISVLDADMPTGTRVEYFLTANGNYWESVQVGREHEFLNPGGDLRYRIVLFSNNGTVTPTVKKIRIDYVREAAPSDIVRTNDATRLGDIREVAYALDKFKTERKSYPIVDAVDPADRWRQMMRLLIDGRFTNRMLTDPRQGTRTDQVYDYLSGNTGASYVMRTRLEDGQHSAFSNDKDGVFAEIPGSYTCNDPWYCEGKNITAGIESGKVLAPAPFSPLTDAKPTGIVSSPIGAPSTAGSGPVPGPVTPAEQRNAVTFDVVQDASGGVWYLASSIGGARMKLAVPSLDALRERVSVAVRVRPMNTKELAKIPRARLVQIEGRKEIFFLTGRWQKRWLPTWEIFRSYKNNALKNVVAVDDALVGLYEDSRLVRLEGDSRVWFIEGDVRRLVPNDRAMRRYQLSWDDVSGMNYTEFMHYQEGPALE